MATNDLPARDFIGSACDCPECRQAGVTHLRLRRDPHTGAWLHGARLRSWYAAKAAFIADVKALNLKTPRGGPLAKLVEREPGSDD